MSMASPRYEFTGEQNRLIGSLADKMKFVGLFAIIVGVINLIMALLAVGAVYRDRVPAEWKTKTKEYVDKARDKLPDDLQNLSGNVSSS